MAHPLASDACAFCNGRLIGNIHLYDEPTIEPGQRCHRAIEIDRAAPWLSPYPGGSGFLVTLSTCLDLFRN
jgi:hypothetical protein